jgi:hypothetical protein
VKTPVVFEGCEEGLLKTLEKVSKKSTSGNWSMASYPDEKEGFKERFLD